MSAHVPTVLHWNYRGFTEFPLQKLQGDETDVVDIYLKENLISRIPSDICKLSNLESLYLSGNDISELPREISKLCSLKCLDISGNRLRFIPDEIAEARNLKFLILDENELEQIPLRLAELRSLRYLSVCDNKLKWLPQRPVYNYHHCEFRFWRNTDLKTIPYSLWYHMFREQQTRCLNIGCLNTMDDKTPGRIKILKTKAAVIRVPGTYHIIMKTPAPPSLFELSKRIFYQLICNTTNAMNNQTLTPFYRKTNEGLNFLEEYLEGINISQSDINGNYKTRLKQNGYQRIYVPTDLIEEYYCYLPSFIKSDLCNGPVSRCENVICKKPVFDFVFLEFCTLKIILIDKTEDVTLSAVFCSKRCADLWKTEKNVLEWELFTIKMLTPRLSVAGWLEKTTEKPETSHGYFHGHKCSLPKDKVTSHEIKCGRLKRIVVDLMTVNISDIRAQQMYKSYSALCAVKYLQFKEYPWTIHPLSKFRLFMEAFIVAIILISDVLLTVHFSRPDPREYALEEYCLLYLDITYLISKITNFFTGYIVGDTCPEEVLEVKRIVAKYLTTWFIPDICSVSNVFYKMFGYESIYFEQLLTSLKIIRLVKLFIHVHSLSDAFKLKFAWNTAIEITLLILIYLIWNIYLQFAVEYMYEDTYTPETPRDCSWISMGNLWNRELTTRFVYSLDRAVGMLRGNANINILEKQGCIKSFFIVAWFISQVLVLHCGFKYLIALFGTESARAQYFIMAKQVEMYLDQKKFPTRIKNKVLKFYAIGFQSHFFAEYRMMSCVSGQLREDIIMHTGRQLVRDVAFLKQLPGSLLFQIGIKLRIVMFVAGDIIMKIKTIGDCLYFIHKGTVAIYCESGKEVCHLEDGDFFGEIALVMTHRLRTASAVAVTNCELFRLDREDFESYVACYPTVYEEIKKVATNRYEQSKMLDDHHKTELNMKRRRKVDLPE